MTEIIKSEAKYSSIKVNLIRMQVSVLIEIGGFGEISISAEIGISVGQK